MMSAVLQMCWSHQRASQMRFRTRSMMKKRYTAHARLYALSCMLARSAILEPVWRVHTEVIDLSQLSKLLLRPS